MKKIYLLSTLIFISIAASAQIVNIPDANFKTALVNISYVNSNGDGEIQVSEALDVTHLHLTSFGINNDPPNISNLTSNLTGLEAFTNLTSLIIEGLSINNFNFPTLSNLMFLELRGNTQLANVNLIPLTNVIYLTCGQSVLTSLDLSTLTNLERLVLDFNSLSSLDFSNNQNLQMLSCANNQLSELNLSNLTQLYYLYCSDNNLTTLDLTNNTLLDRLFCSNNQLTDLIIPDAPYLYRIECYNNQFTTLDFSHTGILKYPHGGSDNIYLFDLPNLVFLNLKTGYPFNANSGSIIAYDPIQYVCTDDFNISFLASQFNTALASGTNVGSYCDFVPGGNYNTISGLFNFDADENGCNFTEVRTTTNLDFPFENVFISMTGSSQNGTFSFADGHYSLFAPQGNFTITPRPIPYFTISPASATVNFSDNNNNTSQINENV